MNYKEFSFTISPKVEFQDILMAFLGTLPFETFIESENGFLAYIPEDFKEIDLKEILENEIFKEVEIKYTTEIIQDKNWNEEWEKDFEPIFVDNQIYIKAAFHPEDDTYPYVIHLQPKMAFGTGHHETTYLMLKTMLGMDFENKSVLDMGCGTAILAVFAKMKGAAYTEAIDIDQWAYDNALENCQINQAEDIVIKIGGAELLGERKFEIILANINKNILLEDIPAYIEVLEEGGSLLLSGLLDIDFEDIKALCVENGLFFVESNQKNEWISILFKK